MLIVNWDLCCLGLSWGSWAFSQHGGRDPRTEALRENQEEAVSPFLIQPQSHTLSFPSLKPAHIQGEEHYTPPLGGKHILLQIGFETLEQWKNFSVPTVG